MAVAATIGHFMLILAYQRATAATLTPYLYVPDGGSLAGMAAIAVCGAASAWLTVIESRRGIGLEPVEV